MCPRLESELLRGTLRSRLGQPRSSGPGSPSSRHWKWRPKPLDLAGCDSCCRRSPADSRPCAASRRVNFNSGLVTPRTRWPALPPTSLGPTQSATDSHASGGEGVVQPSDQRAGPARPVRPRHPPHSHDPPSVRSRLFLSASLARLWVRLGGGHSSSHATLLEDLGLPGATGLVASPKDTSSGQALASGMCVSFPGLPTEAHLPKDAAQVRSSQATVSFDHG